jgi:very-short-patch-repair endonuclease
MIRDRRLAAFKFRRQVVIEPYIVDFKCFSERLIIEADGSQHADNEDDARRDAFLRAQGFRLLRFWNNHILSEDESVAAAIFAALSIPHPPAASRRAQLRGEQHPVLFRSCRGHDRSPQLSPEMGEGLAGAFHA